MAVPYVGVDEHTAKRLADTLASWRTRMRILDTRYLNANEDLRRIKEEQAELEACIVNVECLLKCSGYE
jgi:hypothetical protein